MELQSIKQRFGIVGNNTALNNALNTALQVAPTDLSVLISGESGVGKEVFSQIIHHSGKRKHEPFISINCGAIPEGTISSELFGHEKGAFTGAQDTRKGYFESVNGGTIFLDEVSEMPLETQARLLRVLESGEFIKVGSSAIQKTDVRIIAASNKGLLEQVKKGKFREDLYYRLNTIQIAIPALRERGMDIHLLFRKFCADFAEKYNTSPVQLMDDAVQILINYRWPGNVRQLKHIAEQLSVLSQSKVVDVQQLIQALPIEEEASSMPTVASEDITGVNERELLYRVLFDLKKDVSDLKKVVVKLSTGNINPSTTNNDEVLIQNWDKEVDPADPNTLMLPQATPSVINPVTSSPASPPTLDTDYEEQILSIAEMEKKMIQKALEKYNGRRKEAATELGISERTLYRKIKEYDIDL